MATLAAQHKPSGGEKMYYIKVIPSDNSPGVHLRQCLGAQTNGSYLSRMVKKMIKLNRQICCNLNDINYM